MSNACDEFRSVRCCQVQKETESQRQTRQTERKSERDRPIEWHRARVSCELIWNSSVLVIIREPRQPLLNYRSHQHDWMRLGHCNTNLIIYRLYYYSNNCMGKVSIFPVHPHILYDRTGAMYIIACLKLLWRQILTKLSISSILSALRIKYVTFLNLMSQND